MIPSFYYKSISVKMQIFSAPELQRGNKTQPAAFTQGFSRNSP